MSRSGERAGRALSAALLLVACGGARPPAAGGPELEQLLPEASELPGWEIAEGPDAFSPETLYERLDGGADRYLAHGFRRLLHVRYRLGGDPLASVTLELFDMGSELGAFGIYSALRSPGADIRPWGAEGYRRGAVAAAYRGRLFIHGEADDERPALVELLESAVARAAERAEGGTAPPSVLDPLPAVGRVAHSERYVPADLLGHAFLPGGVLADYEVDGARARLFISRLESETSAAAALADLRGHLSGTGGEGESRPAVGAEGFHFSDAVLGSGTAVRVGRHVAGIHGQLPVDVRERLLASVSASLPSG